MVYNSLPTHRTEVSTCYPLLVVVTFVPHKTPPMVRVDVHYAYGASSGVAGRPSPLTPNRRSATERARAEDVARRNQIAMIAKSRLRSRHDGTWQHHAISIPVWELLVSIFTLCFEALSLLSAPQNELPVRVREEVEIIRRCCLPFWTGTYYDSSCDPDNSNLRRHQLFSQDHVESLDTEIRQWLPRYLCPAFPLSIRCDGG
ncbi:hypothetical protein BC826DRAFT_145404 [Russula brevipes]|nr:hypothetical protein BC826DRAFT_145404 [Russula brevipes]